MGFGCVSAERAAIEATYEDLCTLMRTGPVTGEDGITRDAETTVLKDIPCGLSGKGDASHISDGWQELAYDRTLFLDPEADVRPGDGVEVARFGKKTGFTVVGEPVCYATHQQVPLKIEARPA